MSDSRHNSIKNMITWRENKSGWGGTYGYLNNKMIAFSYHWNVTRKKGDVNQIALRCYLPGIKENLKDQPDVEDAKFYAERVVRSWLQKCGLKLDKERYHGPDFIPIGDCECEFCTKNDARAQCGCTITFRDRFW